MKIKPTDTIEKVMVRDSALFALGFERIFAQVKELELPKRIPLMRPRRRTKYVECRDVMEALTLKELDSISHVEPTPEYVFSALAAMLKIDDADIPHLQFLGAMRYYIEILNSLSLVGKMWKKLETHDEDNTFTPNHTDRGLWTVANTYSNDKHQPIDYAWEARWLDVYLHFEQKHDQYLAQKEQMRRIAAENKLRNTTPHPRIHGYK